MCRSLVEVYDFIESGFPIRMLKKMRKKPEGEGGSNTKKIRGASLLRKTIVGSYNLHTKEISLKATPQVVEKCHQPPLDNIVNNDNEEGATSGNQEKKCDENLTKSETNFGEADKFADAAASSALRDNGDVVPYIVFELLKNN
ncbi:hypothetical protein U1Q18_036940 [Sarracenia purpurea var. burkii]